MEVNKKWSCSECFIANDSSATECVCCKTAKPKKQGSTAAPKAKWSCSECFVSNDDTANDCACCKAPKPKKEAISAAGESWWCDSCAVKNDGSVEKCIACGTGQTSTGKQLVQAGSGDKKSGKRSCNISLFFYACCKGLWSIQFFLLVSGSETKAKWSCSTCFVANEASADACVCCNTAKPKKEKPTGNDAWWCGTCSVKNEASVEKCVACSTERPSRKEISKPDGTEKKATSK